MPPMLMKTNNSIRLLNHSFGMHIILYIKWVYLIHVAPYCYFKYIVETPLSIGLLSNFSVKYNKNFILLYENSLNIGYSNITANKYAIN